MGNLCVARDREEEEAKPLNEVYSRLTSLHQRTLDILQSKERLRQECDGAFRKSRLDRLGSMPRDEIAQFTQRIIDEFHCDDPKYIENISGVFHSSVRARDSLSRMEFQDYMEQILRHIEAHLRNKIEQLRRQSGNSKRAPATVQVNPPHAPQRGDNSQEARQRSLSPMTPMSVDSVRTAQSPMPPNRSFPEPPSSSQLEHQSRSPQHGLRSPMQGPRSASGIPATAVSRSDGKDRQPWASEQQLRVQLGQPRDQQPLRTLHAALEKAHPGGGAPSSISNYSEQQRSQSHSLASSWESLPRSTTQSETNSTRPATTQHIGARSNGGGYAAGTQQQGAPAGNYYQQEYRPPATAPAIPNAYSGDALGEEEDLLLGTWTGPTANGVTSQEMRGLLEEDGLPIFVYNENLEAEPKTLMLDPSRLGHHSLVLLPNEGGHGLHLLRALQSRNDPRVTFFSLSELRCIELGECCRFARVLRTTEEEARIRAMLLGQVPYDRLAVFQFRKGALCVRFLSLTIRDAAVGVVREVCPGVPVQDDVNATRSDISSHISSHVNAGRPPSVSNDALGVSGGSANIFSVNVGDRAPFEGEGMPLFVYNAAMEEEPKRLRLSKEGTHLLLVPRELDLNTSVRSGFSIRSDRSIERQQVDASFPLATLKVIELGSSCRFSSLLRGEVQYERIASLEFVGGSLCVRFASTELRAEAVRALQALQPRVQTNGA